MELYKDTDRYLDNSLHSKTFPRPCISTRSYVKETKEKWKGYVWNTLYYEKYVKNI